MKIDILTLAGLLLVATSALSQKNAPYPAFDNEGHRGGRGLYPENTVVAMLNAIDLGVNLEMDINITANGKAIVSHDECVNSLFTLMPDGKELTKEAGMRYIFYKMNYTDIARFDVGSKFYSKFPQQKKIKAGIPLLSDLIDSVQNHIKTTGKKQVFYNIETKSTEKGDGIYNPDPETFVKILMDVIKSKKILPWVVIQSFDKRTLQIIHKKYPNVRTSWLVDNKKDLAANLDDLGFVPFIYSPNYKMVDATMVTQCHAKGIKVLPWTVNTREEIATQKALGVDGIITDYPDMLVR